MNISASQITELLKRQLTSERSFNSSNSDLFLSIIKKEINYPTISTKEFVTQLSLNVHRPQIISLDQIVKQINSEDLLKIHSLRKSLHKNNI